MDSYNTNKQVKGPTTQSCCSTTTSHPFHWKPENIKCIVTCKYAYKELSVFIKEYNSDNGREGL